MAVRLHIIAGLQNQIALSPNYCPKQAAGKWPFERAVAKGAADIRVCLTVVLEVVVGIRRGYVVRANVLRSFDGGQQLSFSIKHVVPRLSLATSTRVLHLFFQ